MASILRSGVLLTTWEPCTVSFEGHYYKGVDDFMIHYLTTEELRDIAIKAGATKIAIDVIDVGMPHHLAYFPLDYIKKIEEKEVREDLKKRWKDAERMLEEYGEEHPPVIVMTCWK